MQKYLAFVLLLAISSHICAEGSAKLASPYSKSALIKIAMSAGPPSISSDATILDYDGTILRKGTNQWVCNTGGDPQRINPACLDEVWLAWNVRSDSSVRPTALNVFLGSAVFRY